jgi:hypothetical protein
LLEDPEKSYHAPHRVTDHDIFDNRLIFGDNLLALKAQQTIDIPRILLVPKGKVSTGFHPFRLETASIHYQPVDRDLLIQHLRTHEQETLSFGGGRPEEQRLEDYLVRGLIDMARYWRSWSLIVCACSFEGNAHKAYTM